VAVFFSLSLRPFHVLSRFGYEDFSWKKLREYARPADAGIVTKMLQKSSGMIGSAADRVTSTGTSLTNSILIQGQTLFEKIKSVYSGSAAASQTEESEQQKADRLAAAAVEEAGAELIRKAAAEQLPKRCKIQF
jgi:hypothetical protein